MHAKERSLPSCLQLCYLSECALTPFSSLNTQTWAPWGLGWAWFTFMLILKRVATPKQVLHGSVFKFKCDDSLHRSGQHLSFLTCLELSSSVVKI